MDELSPEKVKSKRRRGTRRKAVEEVSDVAECGACGADLAVEARNVEPAVQSLSDVRRLS